MQAKIILISVGLCLTQIGLYACEICGCAPGGYNWGLSTGNGIHAFGLQYSTFSSTSQHESLFGERPITSQQSFSYVTFQSRVQLGKRWISLLQVPLVNRQNKEEGLTHQQTGLGDIPFLLGRTLVLKKDSTREFSWNAFAGIKLPTGKYQDSVSDWVNLMPGSGSWDIPFLSQLQFSKRRFLLTWEESYIYKTYNPNQFRFGDLLSSRIDYKRFLQKKKWVGTLLVGLQHSWYQRDYIRNTNDKVTLNDGQLLQAVIGVGVRFGSFSGSFQTLQPIKQTIGSGLIKIKSTFQISIQYLIQKK